MRSVALGTSSLVSSRLAYGCWRIAGTWDPSTVSPDAAKLGRQAVFAAFEAGYTLFDHADIYCDGLAETIFGQALKEAPEMRGRILVVTKCAIRKAGEPHPKSPFRYDFSFDHIISSCDGSLKRLGVEVIDLYQLHRPDYLMNPEEVARAFERLKQQGKVREFGVSNFRPSQLTVLQKACPMRLIVNQVEISLANRTAFEDGTLDQCLAERITPMAWSPLAGGLLADGAKALLPSQETYSTKRVVAELDAIARAHGTSRSAIALAWLLKHPASIMPIIGSIQPRSIKEAARADSVELTRDEWYRLLEAAIGQRLP
ncbi:MAG: aldo/keto reductase [Verrucomicrobia subdivision 3 bacterium]|nr:aldo/keto reductase [Limisphaerales bacterium]